VIQCKVSLIPVGNKAVQEVYAAMTYYSPTWPRNYEQRVYALSPVPLRHDGVVLILHSEVDRFDELLAAGGSAREPVRLQVRGVGRWT
jgi:hypothetical protein